MSQSYGSGPYQPYYPYPAQAVQPAAFTTYPHSSYGHINTPTFANPPQYQPQFVYQTTHSSYHPYPGYGSAAGAMRHESPQFGYTPFPAATQSYYPDQAFQQPSSSSTYAPNAPAQYNPPYLQLGRTPYQRLIRPPQQQFLQPSQHQPVGRPQLRQIQPPQHTVLRRPQLQEVRPAQENLTRPSQEQHQKQPPYQPTDPTRQTQKASGAIRKRKRKNKIPWQTKLTVSAIECDDEGVQLKEPPLPFYQGWDKDAEQVFGRGKKRKRDDDENYHDEYQDYDYDCYKDEDHDSDWQGTNQGLKTYDNQSPYGYNDHDQDPVYNWSGDHEEDQAYYDNCTYDSNEQSVDNWQDDYQDEEYRTNRSFHRRQGFRTDQEYFYARRRKKQRLRSRH
jgi:hypothetical protein